MLGIIKWVKKLANLKHVNMMPIAGKRQKRNKIMISNGLLGILAPKIECVEVILIDG